MKNELQQEIAKLKAEIEADLQAFDLKRNALRAKQVELHKITCGLSIGDKVQFKYGRDFKTGEVTGFGYRYGDVNTIVTIHKKDGTLGKLTRDYWYQSQPTKISL